LPVGGNDLTDRHPTARNDFPLFSRVSFGSMPAMSTSETFWAPLDRLTLMITLIAAAICMGFPVVYYYFHPVRNLGTALVCLFPIVTFLGVALFSVRSYHVEEGVLRIQRAIWSTRISLRPLESAELQPGVMGRSWRLWGIGGMFGWIGWFRNSSLGTYRAWVTDRQKTVVLKAGGKTYVVSPDQPEKFLQVLQSLKA
jgi:hypothetical protein